MQRKRHRLFPYQKFQGLRKAFPQKSGRLRRRQAVPFWCPVKIRRKIRWILSSGSRKKRASLPGSHPGATAVRAGILSAPSCAKKYLGEEIDIHAGGEDLIFPHHENEIAQSEAATARPLPHYWMHNAFLNIDNRKMCKSAGQFLYRA